MDSSTHPPRLSQTSCLNADPSHPDPACTRCADICPASAIRWRNAMPVVDEDACTGCAACVGVCPADAITHRDVQPVAWLARARDISGQGRARLLAACPAASNCPADIRVPCHAVWDVVLLAAMAAEGVRVLALAGIHACEQCPIRYGATMLARAQQDYDTLNHALGVRLAIEETAPEEASEAGTPATPSTTEEPPRRAFFRQLLPMLAENAAVAAAQIGQTAREAARNDESTGTTEDATEIAPRLPLRLQLFLRALPHLRINFTPVPMMNALPLGAIQASDACTACGDCIPACPTRALSLKPFGRHRILELQPDACIGCRHCIAACPEQALEALPALSLPAVAAGRSRPLIMVRLAGNAAKNQEE